MRLEDRFAPGSVFGDALAASIPSQFAGLMNQSSDAIPPSTSLTLVNLPQADAAPPVDPGVTLYSSPAATDAALVIVASALTQSQDVPASPSVADELFANFAPTTPLAPLPMVPDSAPQGGSSGGSAVSMATVPPAPPATGLPQAPTPPPPVVPPPTSPPTNPPAMPHANDDGYTVTGGTLTVSAASGLLANDTNPTGQPMTAVLVNPPVFGSLSLNADGSFAYTNANPGMTQTVTFTYQASAGGLTSNTATVTLTLTSATPPVANDDAYTLPANGGALTVNAASGVEANDTGPAGQYLMAALVAGPQNGTVSLHADGSFAYTPTPGTSNSDSFTYTVTTGAQTSNVATVTLNIALPTPPTANDDAYTLPADGSPLVVGAAPGLLANDISPGGLALTPVVYSDPSNGTVAVNPDGSFTYTPNAGYAGPDAFTYEVTANGLTSNLATVTLSIAAPPPVANADAYAVNGGTLTVAVSSGLLLNDTTPTGFPVSAALVDAPSNGTVTVNADGSFAYTAYAGSSGTDTFTYQDTAGGETSNVATVTLTVAAFPTANDDAYTLPSGGSPLVVPSTSGVLANDYVPSGVSSAAVVDAAPTHGTLTLMADGSFSYAANPTYNGADGFTYHFTSGTQTSNVANVTLMVGLVGVADSYTVQHDDVLQTDTTSGVLANDTNAGGSAPTASLLTGPAHGALAFNPDGSFTYTPMAGYVGSDSFTYAALADGKTSGPVPVSIDVQDQAPTAPDDAESVHAGQPVSGDLSQIASDPDAQDTLTFVVDANPANGTLQFAATGTFTYQPNQGFVGTDTFTYHTNDGALNSATGTVTISVTDAAPLAGDVTYDMVANTTLNSSSNNVLSNTTDTDGDPLTGRLVTPPSNDPHFVLNPNGTFSYTPTANFDGTDTFTFVANDGTLNSNVATVTINVSADAIPHDHFYVLPESGPLTVSAADGVINDAFNPSNLPISAVLVPSSGGTVEQNPDGSSDEQFADGSNVHLNPDGDFVYTSGANGLPAAGAAFNFTIPPPGPLGGVGWLGNFVAQAILVAAQTKASLKSEMFTSFAAGEKTGQVYGVLRDNGGAYDAGWSSASPDARNPLALLAGDKYNLVVSFTVNNPAAIQPFLNFLTFTVTSDFLKPALLNLKPTATLSGNTLIATWKNVPSPATAGVNDGVNATWKITLPGAPPVPVTSTAHHRIYVLAGKPLGSGKLYHTVVRVGCVAAQGQVATTDEEKDLITKAVMDAFATLKITRADGPIIRTVNKVDFQMPLLGYYRTADPVLKSWDSVAALLKNGEAKCQAWTDFFRAVLQTQGLQKGLAFGITPKADKARMFVKNWSAAPTNRENWLAAGRQFDADFTPDATKTRGTWSYPWLGTPATTKAAGLAGQDSANPLAVFGLHVVAKITYKGDTVLFDPSYGKMYTGDDDNALLLDFQSKALDYVAFTSTAQRNVNGTNRAVLVFKLQRTDTAALLYLKKVVK